MIRPVRTTTRLQHVDLLISSAVPESGMLVVSTKGADEPLASPSETQLLLEESCRRIGMRRLVAGAPEANDA